jgi:hypothetical protein
VLSYDPAAKNQPSLVLSDHHLVQMTGIAIGGDGNFYVADNGAKTIYKYTPASSGFGSPTVFIPSAKVSKDGLPDGPEFLFYVAYAVAS